MGYCSSLQWVSRRVCDSKHVCAMGAAGRVPGRPGGPGIPGAGGRSGHRGVQARARRHGRVGLTAWRWGASLGWRAWRGGRCRPQKQPEGYCASRASRVDCTRRRWVAGAAGRKRNLRACVRACAARAYQTGWARRFAFPVSGSRVVCTTPDCARVRSGRAAYIC